MVWVLGALCLGASMLMIAAYSITLGEIDEVLDDSLRQTALLLADRDLAPSFPVAPAPQPTAPSDTESQLVTIARRPDGALLFSSQPELSLAFSAIPGASLQHADGAEWHVYTVVQGDRVVQVAQPASVRREVAAESATKLLVPLSLLVLMIGALLLVAMRRGMQPLRRTSEALARRSAHSLTPLNEHDVPLELLPLVHTLNELLHRLSAAFVSQRNFIADAAHELRSPVAALQLQVQVLERCLDPAERTEAVRELSAGIARARRLLEQLLSLSRAAADEAQGQALVHATVSLGDLAQSAVVRWSTQAEQRQIDLGADLGSDATVDADPAQLETLLSNLVDNALRYVQRGGTVDVFAGSFEGAPTLRVIDNGPGIADADRSRVFDRFYRTAQAVASAEPGSGLGLAIVKAIADRHRAVVSLHPGRGGAGLEVRVAFPAQAPGRPQ